MLGFTLLLIAILQFERKKEFSLLIIFFFVSNGFQIFPVSLLFIGLQIGLSKSVDFAIIFAIIICIIHFKKALKILNFEKLKLIKWFLLFIIISFVYSWIILDYQLSYIFRVLRTSLIFLLVVPFILTEQQALWRFFKILSIISVLLSIIFILQIFLNKVLLFGAMDDNLGSVTTTNLNQSYTRFYNTPIFIVPALMYFIVVKKTIKPNLRLFSILILLIALVLPMHRTYLIALVCTFLIHFIMNKNNKYKIWILSVFGGVILLLLNIDILNTRITQAVNDIATFSLDAKYIFNESNNFAYRLAHFYERFEYVALDPSKWVFGLGLIVDDAPEAQLLNFRYGYDALTNTNYPISCADISFSSMILQLGILGTILYFKMIISTIRVIYEKTHIGQIAFLFLFFYMFTIFTSNLIIDYSFKFSFILIVAIGIKEKIQKKYLTNGHRSYKN